MGNVEGAIVRNVDKRTSRREHREHFEAAVGRFRDKPFAAPEQSGHAEVLSSRRNVRVCIRKRPIFSHEIEQGEFDVITCLPARVVVHDARMHADMIHMFMNHHDFVFDEAFGETFDSAAVYERSARDLVTASLQGGCGTIMMYGQTGSGKTYTMRSIYELAANDVFAQAEERLVTVCFIELLGDSCFDMLKQGEQCQLASAFDGSVHPYPSVEVEVCDTSELLALIDLAGKLRATAATGVHDQSSRSHALCRIFIEGKTVDGKQEPEGCLTLVDLAGSEHRIDNAEHNPERRKEGAKINASLAALKECIRATAAGAKFISFRQNKLTQILRGCFVGAENHQTVIIATVSPSSKDTEHSLNTLRHACIMDGQGEKKSEHGAHMAGGTVTKENLGEIDVTKIARERKAARKKSEKEGPADEWKKPAPTHQSKQSNLAARAQLDVKHVKALPRNVFRALMDARKVFGTPQQRLRLSRPPPMGAVAALDDQDRAPSPARRKSRRRKSSAPNSARSGHAQDSEASDEEVVNQQPVAGKTQEVMNLVGTEHEKAMQLFRRFCVHGRDACEWRKNDLRLINLCVVPLLYGPSVQIDWAHPNIALDELERLITDTPPPVHFMEASVKPPPVSEPSAAKPPVLPSSAPSTAGRRASLSSREDQPQHQQHQQQHRASTPVLNEDGQPQRPPVVPRGRSPPARKRAVARSASPAVHKPIHDAGEILGVDEYCGPVSHRDAIRARRSALEQARQQSLERALATKLTNVDRNQEICSVEQQLAAGNCNPAVEFGLRKRLAALKAQALREERARKRGPVAPQAVESPAAYGTCSSGAATPVRCGTPVQDLVVDATNQRPRSCCGQPPEDDAPDKTRLAPAHVAGSATPVRSGRRRHGSQGANVGAASAPWANDFSAFPPEDDQD